MPAFSKSLAQKHKMYKESQQQATQVNVSGSWRQRLVDFQKGCSSQQDDLQQGSHDQISIVSLAPRLGKHVKNMFFIVLL